MELFDPPPPQEARSAAQALAASRLKAQETERRGVNMTLSLSVSNGTSGTSLPVNADRRSGGSRLVEGLDIEGGIALSFAGNW